MSAVIDVDTLLDHGAAVVNMVAIDVANRGQQQETKRECLKRIISLIFEADAKFKETGENPLNEIYSPVARLSEEEAGYVDSIARELAGAIHLSVESLLKGVECETPLSLILNCINVIEEDEKSKNVTYH